MYITTTSGEIVLYISWVMIKFIILVDILYFIFEKFVPWLYEKFKKLFSFYPVWKK